MAERNVQSAPYSQYSCFHAKRRETDRKGQNREPPFYTNAVPNSIDTKGILKAEIHTSFGEKHVEHHFDLVAPLANHYRERLLTATHEVKLVYPVLLTAEAFAPRGPGCPPYPVPLGDLGANQRVAATDAAFMKLVGEVFGSPTVQSLLHALIAVSNEVSRPEGMESASSADPSAQ